MGSEPVERRGVVEVFLALFFVVTLVCEVVLGFVVTAGLSVCRFALILLVRVGVPAFPNGCCLYLGG